MPASRIIWDMGELPFHVGPLSRPEAEGYPDRLPFRVGFDDDLGLFTQVFDERILQTLRDVYARGSQLGVPMADHGLGKAYADDFRTVIGKWLGDGLAAARLLEVGCGSGHLLAALAAAGADVAGVEPDRRCAEAMRQRGIPVATCELEEYRPERSFDCVVHYCVLEHAPDPVRFLALQRELLAPGGTIVCAVPDCGEALAAGDISIFIHQHWSYFTTGSLRRLAAAAGLRVAALRRAAVGGLLYAHMVPAESSTAGADGGARGDDGTGELSGIEKNNGRAEPAQPEPDELVARGRRGRERFAAYVHGRAEQGASLGIYCPGRAINYVPPDDAVLRAPRLFDDAPALHGKYMPPFISPVEGGAGLEHQGVGEVLIMSRSFGAAIELAIRSRRLDPMPTIRHIDEVLRA